MTTSASRLGSLLRRGTPRFISISIVVILFLDLVLGLVLLKQSRYPLSLTWGDYLFLVGDRVSVWTGRMVWIVVIAWTVLLPLLRGKQANIPEVSAFAQTFLKKIPAALAQLVVAVPVLVLTTAFLMVLGVHAWSVSTPPAPPPAGRLILPTNPQSTMMYRVADGSVVVYNRKQSSASGPLLPYRVFQLKDSGRIEKIAITSDERRIFATDFDRGLVHVVDTESSSNYEKQQLSVGRTASAIALSGDGRKLYVGVQGPVPEGTIDVFDSHSLREITSMDKVGCPVDLFAASKEPLLFVATQCGGGNDPLYVFDTRTDKLKKELPGFAVGSAVVATPDGSEVFVSTGDSLRIVKDYMTDRPYVRKIDMPVSSMAVSPDGRMLLVGTRNGIMSFDLQSEQVCLPTQLEADPSAIAFAPDGSVLASLPERIFLSDSKALECKKGVPLSKLAK
jgi:WD40 repeat protein